MDSYLQIFVVRNHVSIVVLCFRILSASSKKVPPFKFVVVFAFIVNPLTSTTNKHSR